MINKNILILIPGDDARGGITNYYHSIKMYLPATIYYQHRGSRQWPQRKFFILELWRAIIDIMKFINNLVVNKIDLVQTTTSLSSRALLRDGIFIVLSKIFNIKVIVFFRGWDYNFADSLNGLRLKIFRYTFFKSDSLIDLSGENKKRLIDWGYKKNIFVETTVFDESIEKAVKFENISHKYSTTLHNINILFLARVEKSKGIYEAIEAFAALDISQIEYKLIIAGDGKELEEVKKYVSTKSIDNVSFLGFVTGTSKISAYTNAHIYLFPTYNEGMPNSVLEAMACGLPILTTKVGGIPDIFENGRNGYFIDVNNIPDITEKLVILCSDKKKMLEMGQINYFYARDNFSAKKVASRIISIFEEILQN